MKSRHRPDLYAADRATRHGVKTYRASDKNAYMWPYINQEDLAKPRLLPLFMNTRGRNPPWVFRQTDMASTMIGDVVGGIDELWLNRHRMLFQETPETYGKLVQYTPNEEAKQMAEERAQVPGSGLTTLAIQEWILRFLVSCCHSILHDIPTEDLLNYPILPEPSHESESSNSSVSLATMVLEAPYRVPNSMDLPRLKAVISAKRSAAEDHVWALREDPSYLLDCLKEAMDHRFEHVKDWRGRQHENFKSGRDALVWSSVVSNVVCAAEWHLELWTKLCEILANVETQMEGQQLDGQLPQDLRFELSYLHSYLKHAMRGPQAQLKAAFYSSPPMRQYVERVGEDTPRARKTGICPPKLKLNMAVSKELMQVDSPEDKLLWLVDCLTQEHQGLLPAEVWGYSTIMDELGRLVEQEPRVRKLVSSHVAKLCLTSLSLQRRYVRWTRFRGRSTHSRSCR